MTPNSAILFDDGSGGRNKLKRYVYDFVFNDSSTQEVVYQKTTAPLVKDVLSGFSAAVFAYGATGSGQFYIRPWTPKINIFSFSFISCRKVSCCYLNKLLTAGLFAHINEFALFRTHTMLGPNPRKAMTPSTGLPSSSGSDSNNTGDGLMVKAIADIFKFVEASEDPREFRVSFVEDCSGAFRGSTQMKIYAKIVYVLLGKMCSWIQSTKAQAAWFPNLSVTEPIEFWEEEGKLYHPKTRPFIFGELSEAEIIHLSWLFFFCGLLWHAESWTSFMKA